MARDIEPRAAGAADGAEPPDMAADPQDDTPDLEALAAQQGVKPVTNIDELYGDFWPEDEDINEFVATIRRWRKEGYDT